MQHITTQQTQWTVINTEMTLSADHLKKQHVHDPVIYFMTNDGAANKHTCMLNIASYPVQQVQDNLFMCIFISWTLIAFCVCVCVCMNKQKKLIITMETVQETEGSAAEESAFTLTLTSVHTVQDDVCMMQSSGTNIQRDKFILCWSTVDVRAAQRERESQNKHLK